MATKAKKAEACPKPAAAAAPKPPPTTGGKAKGLKAKGK